MVIGRDRNGYPAPRCLRWGVAYRGTGEVATTVAAVVDTLEELGLEVGTVEVSGGAVAIEAEDRRSLYRRLSAKVPNRVSGWVEPVPGGEGAEEGLRLCLDLTLAPGYRAVVVALWAYWALGLAYLFGATAPGTGWSGPGAAVALAAGFMGVVALVGCDAFLLRVLGGGWMGQVLWEPVLRRLEASGGAVEPEGTGIGRRYLFWFGGYGLSFFLCGVFMVAFTELETSGSTPGLLPVLLFGLLAVVVLLLVTAAVMALWRGFAVRAGAVVLGLAGPLAMVFLLALPLPLLLVQGPTGLLPAVEGEDLAWWSRLLLVGTVIVGGTGVSLAGTMVRAAVPGRGHLQRAHRHRGARGIYREGIRGGRLLVVLRALFVASALGLGIMVLAALSLALLWAVHAVVPIWSGALLRLPEMTGPLLAATLGLPRGHPWAEAVARSAWVLWAGGAWGLLGVSVGQLAWERRRCRRCLLARSPRSSAPVRELADRLERLLRQSVSGGPSVRLSVSRSPAVAAHSYRFSRPGGEWFVEVTDGALRRLAPEELEALVAHELSHLVRGHALRHDLARWLGRVAFLGDGFCRGLLDSFHWECEADADVVLRWGVSGEILIRCLQKMSAVNAQGGVRSSAGLPLCSGQTGPVRDDGQPADGSAWSQAWRLFREQYFHAGHLQYWHPVTDERIDRILGLDRSAPVPGGAS